MLYDQRWDAKTKADPFTAEPWRATLLKAAMLVRERGLAKGTQEDSEGRVCLHGAISIAATGRPHSDNGLCRQAGAAVCHYLKSRGIDYISDSGAAEWNTQPERTQEEVIAALEGAALTRAARAVLTERAGA